MDQYIKVGTIASTHALKGEVKVYSRTDFNDIRFKVGNELYIKNNDQYLKVKIKSHRVHQSYDLVSFEDYQDINKVLPFVKCDVYIAGDQLHELEEDEFYYFELTDCDVYDKENYVGKVKNVVNYGASDLLVVQNQKQKEIMIPFVDEFIASVDLEKKKIMIHVIEGLLGETHED